MKYVPAAINVKYFMPQNAGPKIGGVTLHIFAVIKLKCAVIKSKLGSVILKMSQHIQPISIILHMKEYIPIYL